MDAEDNVIDFSSRRTKKRPNKEQPTDLVSFNEIYLPLSEFQSTKAWIRGRRKNMAIAGAATALFLASYHQRPPGTLPDNDDFLAEKSGLADAEWDALRGDVMSDWALENGRWSSPLSLEVAGKALAARINNWQRASNAAKALHGGRGLVADPADAGIPF